MLPIIRDPFWSPLAFTVIGGLVVAAALTLIFLPVLYVLWFRIPAKATSEAAAGPAAPEQQPVAAGG
jgi:predicted RND superfamily exporter protein